MRLCIVIDGPRNRRNDHALEACCERAPMFYYAVILPISINSIFNIIMLNELQITIYFISFQWTIKRWLQSFQIICYCATLKKSYIGASPLYTYSSIYAVDNHRRKLKFDTHTPNEV